MNDKRYRMLGTRSDKELSEKNVDISAREDCNTMSNNLDPFLAAFQIEKQELEEVNHGLKVAFAENLDRSGALDAFRLSFNEELGATYGEGRTDSPSGARYEVSSKFGTESELDIFSIFYTLEKETGRDNRAERASQRKLMLETELAKQPIEDGPSAASKKAKRSEMIEEQRKIKRGEVGVESLMCKPCHQAGNERAPFDEHMPAEVTSSADVDMMMEA